MLLCVNPHVYVYQDCIHSFERKTVNIYGHLIGGGECLTSVHVKDPLQGNIRKGQLQADGVSVSDKAKDSVLWEILTTN